MSSYALWMPPNPQPSSLESLLPITALVAILLFVAREIFDFFRRRSADGRRVKALKLIIARECELNSYTVANLRLIFHEVDTEERPNPYTRVAVEKGGGGDPYVKVTRVDDEDEGWHSYSIGQVHRDVMSKTLLDVATLDQALFRLVESAYDGLAVLEHLRDSLISESIGKSHLGESSYMQGLTNYALNELTKIEAALFALYHCCTGRDTLKSRIR